MSPSPIPVRPLGPPRRPDGSLRAIADKAGVTKATASRVLNNRYQGFSVRPEVRDRILAAAAELGYAPDLTARALRAERMNLVGAVGLHPPYVFIQDLFLGIVEVLQPAGVQLSLHLPAPPEDLDRPPPWRVDGVFVISTANVEAITPIDASGLPYVAINAACGPNGGSILFDDAQGTRAALRHLLDLGHHHIAYANPAADAPHHPSLQIRHQTFLEVLREAALSPVPSPECDALNHPVEFLRAVRQAGATAVLTYYHHAAIALLRAAALLGLQVPKDLSIVCFNNAYGIEMLHPSLTAVGLPHTAAGRAAATMLLRLINGEPTESRQIVFPETLYPRESSGPAPRSHSR